MDEWRNLNYGQTKRAKPLTQKRETGIAVKQIMWQPSFAGSWQKLETKKEENKENNKEKIYGLLKPPRLFVEL